MKKVILVDDEPFILDAITRCLFEIDADIYRFTSPREALEFCARQKPDLIISDQRMPGMQGTEMLTEIKAKWPQVQCILLSAYNDFEAVAQAFNQQVIERYICKPWNDEELAFVVSKSLASAEVNPEAMLQDANSTQPASSGFHGMVSASPLMAAVFEKITKAGTANVPIFITGETGTGKELVAKACHDESFRADHPFIAVNCANFTETLIESQIFGHRKGAFTGADKDQDGIITAAGKGTLFLDEVTTLPLSLQAKLLRVIQEREFSPLGSHKLLPFEAQLVTASSTSLLQAVKAGNFREDLFYRLNVLVINLPPLRDRLGDVPVLANYLLKQLVASSDHDVVGFSSQAMAVLCDYHWPGNIRQMENFIHSLIVLTNDTEISALLCEQQLQHFSELSGALSKEAQSQGNKLFEPESTAPKLVAPRTGDVERNDAIRPLWLQEKAAIERAIEHCNGNVPRAAALLEVSPSTIYRKLQAWENRNS